MSTEVDLRAEILSAPAGKPEPVQAFGRTLYVRRMTSEERDAWEAAVVNSKKGGKTDLRNLRARLAVRVLAGADGVRIFRDDDAAALGKKNAYDLDVIFKTAQRINNVSDDDLKELAGNCDGDPNDSTGSA